MSLPRCCNLFPKPVRSREKAPSPVFPLLLTRLEEKKSKDVQIKLFYLLQRPCWGRHCLRVCGGSVFLSRLNPSWSSRPLLPNDADCEHPLGGWNSVWPKEAENRPELFRTDLWEFRLEISPCKFIYCINQDVNRNLSLFDALKSLKKNLHYVNFIWMTFILMCRACFLFNSSPCTVSLLSCSPSLSETSWIISFKYETWWLFPGMTSSQEPRAAVTVPLSRSLAALFFPLKRFLFLLPSRSISGERWILTSAQPSRPYKGGTAGLEARWVLWLTVLIISVMGAGDGKVGGKQLFRKCHHQRSPLRWSRLQQVRGGREPGGQRVESEVERKD